MTDDWEDVDVTEGDSDWEDESEEQVDETEPQIEVDPNDPVRFPEKFYTVQMAYEQAGKVIEAGTDIQVKCANCAAWDAPLGARNGKPLCRPGRTAIVNVDGDAHEWRMAEERYSCQMHFIPKDMDEFLQHMRDDLEYVKMLRWSWPAIQKLVKLQERVQSYCGRNNRDADKTINSVLDFVALFTSQQQIDYTKPFVKAIIEGLQQTKPKTTRRRSAFQPGDVVSWEVSPGGPRAEGFIRTIGRGRNANIIILVSGEHVQTLSPEETSSNIQWQRPLAEWKKMDPQRVAATPVVSDQDG